MNHIGFGQSSFALNSLGLSAPVASGPKLQADFTTGTYKSNGAAKTFADLFTFTRAGKAWLVKETGLQEYATDVPRLDNGLLIEQSATNLFNEGVLQADKLTGFKTGASNLTSYSYVELVAGDALTVRFQPPQTGDYTHSYVLTRDNGSTDILLSNSPNIIYDARLDSNPVFVSKAGGFVTWSASLSSSTGNATYIGLTKFAGQSVKGELRVHARQAELGTKTTSFIPTFNTPVTRPADFLTSKITGTTVTGDWDSTLTLSIVAGKLVHSGYGRIRSLEIN